MATLKSIKNDGAYLVAADIEGLPGPGPDENKNQIQLLHFKFQAGNALNKYDMQDGFVDQYEDATGVDSGASTNLTYDSGDDFHWGYVSGTVTTNFGNQTSDQVYTAPANTVSGVVKLQGSQGGQQHGLAGDGGFVEATIPLTGGTTYRIVGGAIGAGENTGGYGGGGSGSWAGASSGGGGLSGIFNDGGTAIDFSAEASFDRAILVAGAGGAVGHYHFGCHGTSQYEGGDVTSNGAGGDGSGNGWTSQGEVMAGGSGGVGGGGGHPGGEGCGSSCGGASGANFVSPNATATAENTNVPSTGDPFASDSHGKLEIVSTQQAALDITLLSGAYTAVAAPATARLMLFQQDVDACTINTDIKGYVSRDGGTTYTEITAMVDEGLWQAGSKIYAGSVDISGQPSGTSMKYKITTHNTKKTKTHGVAMIWAT